MHEALNRLIELYGIWGVFLVTLVEGEFGPLIGGSLAQIGQLNLLAVLLVTWVAATLSTTAFFVVGRSQRDGRFVHKVTQKRAFSLALKWIDRHPRLFCFFYRFVYGLRIVGPVAISLSHVRWQTFVFLNVLASLVWAIGGTAAGWFFGPKIAGMVAYYFTEEPYLFASIAAGIALIGGIAWRARRSAKRRQSATSNPATRPISPASAAD